MEVDFNNLRKQTAYALDNVIKALNRGIMPGNEYAFHSVNGKEKQFEGNLLVSVDDLEKDLSHLSTCVWSLLCCYEENNPAYKDLSDDLEDGIARFNPSEEDYYD